MRLDFTRHVRLIAQLDCHIFNHEIRLIEITEYYSVLKQDIRLTATGLLKMFFGREAIWLRATGLLHKSGSRCLECLIFKTKIRLTATGSFPN